MKKWFVLFLAIIFAGIIFISCSDDTTSPEPVPEPVISENVEVLELADISNLDSISTDGVIFSFSDLDSSVVVGDIIVGDISDKASEGFLRRVLQISKSKSSVVLTTEQATLEDVFEECDFQIEKEISAEDIKSFTSLEGVEIIENDKNKGTISLTLTDVELYNDNGAEIKLNGSFNFDSSYKLDLKIGGWELQHLKFTHPIVENTNLELTSTVTLESKKEKTVGSYNLGGFTFWVGFVPVVVSSTLEIVVGADGKVTAGITTGFTQNSTLNVGLEYDGTSWSAIDDFTNDFNWKPYEAETTAKVQVYIEPKLALKVYGVEGPFAKVKGYGELDAKMSTENDSLKIYGGVEANVGVKIEILSRTLADYENKVIDWKKLLYEYVNLPPVINSLTANPTSVEISESTTITCLATEPNSDPITYSWDATGGSFGGSGTSVTWTAPSTPGGYNITCIASDGRKTDMEYLMITVTDLSNNPPVINSLIADPTSVELNGVSTITCNASDADGDNLTYAWGASAGNITGSESSVTWTAPDSIGTNTITCIVSDGTNNDVNSVIITVAIPDTIPPTVNIVYPIDTEEFEEGDLVVIEGNAADDAGITKVDFYIDDLQFVGSDTSSPYEYTWDTLGFLGSHIIKLVAYDTNNNYTISDSITVIVNEGVDTTPPTIELIKPTSFNTTSPYSIDGFYQYETIRLEGNASDNDGIYDVKFYIDDTFVWNDYYAPYDYIWNWNLTVSGLGIHDIKLTATDSSQNYATSEITSINVVPAIIIAFQDSIFEQDVRGYVNKPTGDIYLTDVWSKTSFSSYNDSLISDITGMEYFSSLNYLYIAADKITDLSPIADLTNLMLIHLNQNQIVDISSLTNLTNLTEIWFQYNQIVDISSLSNLVNLFEVDLSYNQITNVPSLNSTNLSYLNLGYNQITSIPSLSSLTNLSYLNLGYNQIVDISGLSNLTNSTNFNLILSGNDITNIEPLVQNASLSAGDGIWLYDNPLDSVSVNTHIPALLARGVSVSY